MSASYDAAVLGGGPAGVAVALGLARRGRSVVIFERSRYEGPRFGETLGPEIQPLLCEMGAWEQFAATPRLPFRTIASSWGAPDVLDRPSILHPLGEGWHVDRAAVDRALSCAVSESGIPLQTGAGFCVVTRSRSGWEIAPAHGPAITARFLVDASGRGAPATTSLFPERTWVKADQLIAVLVRFEPPDAGSVSGELLLESAEAGWWYSVPLPDGALLVTWMTDADLLPSGGRTALEQAWRAALAETAYTCGRVGAGHSGAIRITRADSGFSSPASGPGWLMVGDAALAYDPLSGSGFARALRSGLEAADSVDKALNGHGTFVDMRSRFEVYVRRRAEYYSRETRWPGSPFWMRRQHSTDMPRTPAPRNGTDGHAQSAGLD